MRLQLGRAKKLFHFKMPSLTLGVRGSLFLAFAVIAGMAIVISVSASVMLGQLGGMMNTLSSQDIPRLAASLQLSAQSANLSNQGQALLALRQRGRPEGTYRRDASHATNRRGETG